MEVTINYNGQAVAVEVTLEVYEFLDQADHNTENLFHEQRRHWDGREIDEYIITTEGVGVYGETPEEYLCRMETLHELMAVLDTDTAIVRSHFFPATYAGPPCPCPLYAGYESERYCRNGGYHTIAGGKIHPRCTAEAAPVLCASEMDGQSMSVSKEKRCMT